MKLTDFEALSFDCYGTLIDWETGLLKALEPLVRLLPERPTASQILEEFAHEESAQEAETPTLLYRDVLARVHRRLADKWQVEAPSRLASVFGGSVGQWPAFADSASSLMYLAKYFELIVLSNVDNQSFVASQSRLAVKFDAVYSAEDIGSYKPARRNFEYLIAKAEQELGISRDRILHVAQSQFHDHEPARQIGLANAWIDRRHAVAGWGATSPPGSELEFDFRFNSLAELVAAHQQDLRQP